MERILAIDVGGGTQDILLFEGNKVIENCVKMVLPAQTVIVAERIHAATAEGIPVFLNGSLMGGGASIGALRRHLNAGLKVYASPDAALTINDDLQKVTDMGIDITGNPPAGVKEINMRDVDLEAIEEALQLFGVEMPNKFAVAVQDHGEAIGQSNREFRFKQWEKFIKRGGEILDLVYFDIPFHFTRMRSVQKDVSGALLMDTGAAAIWGALCDPYVGEESNKGVTIVNVGNQHTIGVLLKGRRIFGLFEHHTKLLQASDILNYITKMQEGNLTHQEVFDTRGHGAYISTEAKEHSFNNLLVVTGPNRNLLAKRGIYFAAPYGDMMLTGSVGLVAAYYEKTGRGVMGLL